ncbi:MAG: Ig-like domain-containing protein [Treponema sp.]|nr:Ig-like domain-containing protein [Treponema sp.]
MVKSKLFCIIGILIIAALVFTGCPDEDGNGEEDGDYVEVTTLSITTSPNNLVNSINNDQTRPLNAVTNTGVHSSLTIEWTTSNANGIEFVVNSVGSSTATGSSVTIRGKALPVNTLVTITATAKTINPEDEDDIAIVVQTRDFTVIATEIILPSIEWLFPVSLAVSLGFSPDANSPPRYLITSEKTLDTKPLEGLNIGFVLVRNDTNNMEFRSGQGKDGYLQPNSGTGFDFGRLTGIPANVKVAITFEFAGTSDNTDTNRRPRVTNPAGGFLYTTEYSQNQSWITGKIEVTSNGSAISLGIQNGCRIAGVKVEVLETPPLTGLSLAAAQSTIRQGLPNTLSFTRTPIGATQAAIEWIYDSDFFTLVDNGDDTATVTGKVPTSEPKPIKVQAAGNAAVFSTVNITVTAFTGNEIFVETVTIDSENFELFLGGTTTKQLGAEVLPDEADIKTLNWTTSAPLVATVSNTGLVTAVGKGTATITAEAMDGSGKNDFVTVTVKQLVTSINVGDGNGKIFLNFDGSDGGTAIINAGLLSVLPADANLRSVTWSSGDELIATVDQDRLVTATGIGKTKIIATADDGSGIFGAVDVEVINFTAGTPDKHWDFTTALTIGANDIEYNGMTIYGSRRAGLAVNTTQGVGTSGLLTAGCLNSGGSTPNDNYLVIHNVEGPFKLVVFHNAGNDENSGRSLNIYTAPAGTMAGSNGTLAVTGATVVGTTVGQEPTMIEYEYTGFDSIDVGFRQIGGAVRIQDIYLYYHLPSDGNIRITAEDNKTSIIAGNTEETVAAETLQFSARQDRQDVSEEATWSVRVSNDITSANVDAAIAVISATGLLTAADNLASDTDVWVFAENNGKQSAGYKVTIEMWKDDSGPQLYRMGIGSLNPANHTVINGNGTLTMRGHGQVSDLTNGNFVFMKLPEGDFTMMVKIDSLTFGNSGNTNRVGIIAFNDATLTLNETTGALTGIVPASTVYGSYQLRPDTATNARGIGGSTVRTGAAGFTNGTIFLSAPDATTFGNVVGGPNAGQPVTSVWIRLQRRSGQIFGAWSLDGTTWQVEHNQATGTLANFGSGYIGLLVGSNNNTNTTTATFSSLHFKSGTGMGVTTITTSQLDAIPFEDIIGVTP